MISGGDSRVASGDGSASGRPRKTGKRSNPPFPNAHTQNLLRTATAANRSAVDPRKAQSPLTPLFASFDHSEERGRAVRPSRLVAPPALGRATLARQPVHRARHAGVARSVGRDARRRLGAPQARPERRRVRALVPRFSLPPSDPIDAMENRVVMLPPRASARTSKAAAPRAGPRAPRRAARTASARAARSRRRFASAAPSRSASIGR